MKNIRKNCKEIMQNFECLKKKTEKILRNFRRTFWKRNIGKSCILIN